MPAPGFAGYQGPPWLREEQQQPIVSDSEQDAVQQKAQELNLALDDTTKENLVNYVLSEDSAENAFARSRKYNQELYGDLVAGLKKAGLNPFLALQGLNGSNLMSGNSYSGGYTTQRKTAQETSNKQLGANILGSILMAIALVIAHAI